VPAQNAIEVRIELKVVLVKIIEELIRAKNLRPRDAKSANIVHVSANKECSRVP
jgi:hypothetical protein